MNDTRKYIDLLNPRGRAFSINPNRAKWNNVLSNSMERVNDNVQLYLDELYPVNDNFNLEEWEDRYDIVPTIDQTLAQRRAKVKQRIDYPNGSVNRSSLDFLQKQVTDAGFPNVVLGYNELGTAPYLRLYANSLTPETSYTTGADNYNSFVINGTCEVYQHDQLILLLLSLKPLDVVIYDNIDFNVVVALDENTAVALDASTTLAIPYV